MGVDTAANSASPSVLGAFAAGWDVVAGVMGTMGDDGGGLLADIGAWASSVVDVDALAVGALELTGLALGSVGIEFATSAAIGCRVAGVDLSEFAVGNVADAT